MASGPSSVTMPNLPRVRSRRVQLLPDDRYLGWLPFVWLVYYPSVFYAPAVRHASARTWVLTGVAAVVFLPLYFRGYWARGRERDGIVAAIALLGLGLAPVNPSATVFLIYAGAFAGMIPPARRALVVVGALCAAALLETWVLHLPIGVWAIALFFTAMVGGINVHFATVRGGNAALRLAREEIEHLATVAERERIARDLHDVLGHTLTLVTLKSALASRLAERDPARAAVEIREVERIAREALGEVRAAVAGYRDAGLARELAGAATMLTAAGVTVETDVAAVPLAPREEATLALVVREAVTNVARHARAATCRITLADADGTRTLAVTDDGRGMSGAGTTGSFGHGLAGMRERVAALGGTLAVDATAGAGTRVRVTLPTRPAPAGVSA